MISQNPVSYFLFVIVCYVKLMVADISKYSTEGCLVASVGFIKGQHKAGGESGDNIFPKAIRKANSTQSNSFTMEEQPYHTGM
jgi:hypothetical protein